MFWPIVLLCGTLSGQCYIIEDPLAPFDTLSECQESLPAMNIFAATQVLYGKAIFEDPFEDVELEDCCVGEAPEGVHTRLDICVHPNA